jgi:peptide/nickel transport system substrate-binding protein
MERGRKMKKLNLFIFFSLIVISLLFPFLCMSQPKYGGTLTVGIESDIKQIDPHKGVTAIEGRIYTLFADNLVVSSKNNEPYPGLAASWDVSKDAKEWTFRLRKGVKFHNGREMTAEDIKFNMDRAFDPKTASPIRSRFIIVESVKVIDRYTVKFILKKPAGGFLALFFGGAAQQTPIIARECVKEDGTVTHPIGTGPFEFVEWKPNDHIRLKKSIHYWGKGLPYLDELILKPVPEETVRLTALRTGDLDVAFPLPIDEVAKLMKKPQKDFYFLQDATAGVYFIHFNVSKPPFNDVRVRQAIAYGINKKEMAEGIFQGYGEVLNQGFPKRSPWYCDVPSIVRDVGKAKALLKEAGYPDGLEVALTTSNTYPYQLIMGEIAQEQLKEIGMKIKLDLNDWPTTIKKMIGGDFHFGIIHWGPIVADPDLLYTTAFTPKNAYSWLTGNAYNNPPLTELLEQASATLDFNKRKELYTKAVKIIIDDAPWIFTVEGPGPFGARSHVKGLESHPNGLFAYGGGGFQYTWLDK